jgi:hypothetical protein
LGAISTKWSRNLGFGKEVLECTTTELARLVRTGGGLEYV